jgi:hypothetical protein
VKQDVSTPREKAREWGRWDSTRGNRAGLENVVYRTSKIKKKSFLDNFAMGCNDFALFLSGCKSKFEGTFSKDIFVFCCFVLFFASKFDKSVNMT